MRVLKRALGWSSFAALTVGLACSNSDSGGPAANPDAGIDSGTAANDACAGIDEAVKNSFDTLAKFVSIQTYRTQSLDDEPKVSANIQKIRDALQTEIDALNAGQKKDKITSFTWHKDNATAKGGDPKTFEVFGVKLGHGPYRVALETHLDTVPPGEAPWQPFTLKKEMRKGWRDGKETDSQEFWIGRGSIDDKGPAISTLEVLKALARKYDGSDLLNHVTVELIFDTSEETTMSMPNYFADNPKEEPDLAVIFDAEWCVRAEKGIERPIFSIARDMVTAPTGVYIASLDTPSGPANQIPDTATAVLMADGASQTKLQNLGKKIADLYATHVFDNDATYRRAKLTVDTSVAGKITLTTHVEGAQHGSKPQENRLQGTNPLVSLANFLGDLVNSTDASINLADNDVGHMCKFIQWAWGTWVFGEKQPALLQRSDDIFLENKDLSYDQHNGTTYALTRLYTGKGAGSTIQLVIDIRYALGHHSKAWDGKTEGLVGGDGSLSVFNDTFTKLANGFNGAGAVHPVSFVTKTAFAPDVRLPTGPTFTRINEAYRAATGQDCPARAIGGGTDAKGHSKFLAAGALFDDHFGPPINFHGQSEGAPLRDLQLSTQIVCRLLDKEIQRSPTVAQSSTLQSSVTERADVGWGSVRVRDEDH